MRAQEGQGGRRVRLRPDRVEPARPRHRLPRDAQKRQDVPTYQLARTSTRSTSTRSATPTAPTRCASSTREVLWALKEWKNAAGEYDRSRVEDRQEGEGQVRAQRGVQLDPRLREVGLRGRRGQARRRQEDRREGEEGQVGRRSSPRRSRSPTSRRTRSTTRSPSPINELKLSAACDLYFDIADPKDEDLPPSSSRRPSSTTSTTTSSKRPALLRDHRAVAGRRPVEEVGEPDPRLAQRAAAVGRAGEVRPRLPRQQEAVGPTRSSPKSSRCWSRAPRSSPSSWPSRGRGTRSSPMTEAAGGLAKVATRFRGFQKEFPESKYADKADVQRAVIYNKADELDSAIEAAELLVKKYEKSDLNEKTALPARRLLRAHRGLRGGGEARTRVLRQVQRSEGHEGRRRQGTGGGPQVRSPEAGVGRAVQLRRVLPGPRRLEEGHLEKFELYTKEFADSADASEVYWRICEISGRATRTGRRPSECYDKFKRQVQEGLAGPRVRVPLQASL
jgi:hypothetical protein